MESYKYTGVAQKTNFSFIFRAFKYRNYRLFFGGQCISLTGTWMQSIAMSWLVYRITNSALLLGIVGFSSQIPTIFLTPLAGAIIDRWPRLRILIITQILAMFQAFILAVLVLTGKIQVWHIVFLSVFLGLVNSFDMPVRKAFVVDIVEKKEDLSNAIALNSSMFNGARLIGPSIAGLIIAGMGEGICFLINAISYIFVILALFAMKIKHVQKIDKQNGILYDIKEGFTYAFGFKPIRYILVLIMLISLMGMSYAVLMPIFAKNILHGGPHTLGFLIACAGTGALVASIYLASRTSVIGLPKLIAAGACLFGAGLVLFSFSRVYYLSLILMFFTGFGMMIQLASSDTVLQTILDDDKRGRVMSFYTLSFMGVMPLGSLQGGVMASWIGAPNALLIGGLACVLGSIIFASKVKSINNILCKGNF